MKAPVPEEIEEALPLPRAGTAGDPGETYQEDLDAERDHAPGRLIVQLTPELTDAVNADAEAGLPFGRWSWPGKMLEILTELRVHEVTPVFPLGSASPEKLAALQETYARRHKRVDTSRPLPRIDTFFVFELPLEAELGDAQAALEALEVVLSTERDVVVRTLNTYGSPTYQWGLHVVQAPQVWATTEGAGVNVAVVDTGVDLQHPDLQGNLLPGANFVPYANSAQDDNGHGTHVAGVIAAVNNTQGIIGVAPSAKIIPIKALNNGGNGLTTWLTDAYQYAINTGITDVINNSWGGAGTSAIMTTLHQVAHQLGIITVNAAGNASTTTYGFFPSNIEYGLSVAASDALDGHASYSNTGVKLDVAAPGGEGSTYATGILSTVHGGYSGNGVLLDQGAKYAPMSGTSMAAPHVSGLAALLIAANPGWTVEQIRQAIRMGADDIGAPGFDVTSGHGRINAVASLQVPQPPSAQVIVPRNDETVSGDVPVYGFALPTPGQNVVWEVLGGAGTAPTSWVSLAQGTNAVSDAALSTVDTRLLPEGEATLMLRSRNLQNGQEAEDRNLVHIDNVAITWPTDGTFLPGINQAPIWGRVEGVGLQSWILEWAPGFDATGGFTTITTGTSTVVANSTMTSWDLSTLPEGELSLRLTAHFAGYTTSHLVNVVVDRRLLPGFPARILDPMGRKTPKIADLDLDGVSEIVVGDAVYRADGNVRPGWTHDPKLGRTVPAIADIDGKPGLEIVNVGFESYFHDGALPNGGAPTVTAKRADNTTIWTFPVTHPTSAYHNATPSSVSIGNVTGDSKPEVVFSVFFNHSNPNKETTVFVLDAATGAQLHRWTVPGFSWSASALADLDKDGLQEIVFTTYESGTQIGRVHAMRADGTALPGWPQVGPSAQGFGELAPVIGDVDRDCRYEILAGPTLYRRDGSPMPGWPATNLNRSTGALANIKGGYPLEVILGSGNHVTARYVDSDGSLNRSFHRTFENLWVIGANENYKQGHPLLADVDGDGEIDLVRSAEAGTTDPNRPVPLYAYDMVTGQPKDHTRRVRTTAPHGNSSYPIYSTAAVGDVDGDGMLDMVVVANNLLYAWRLDAPAVPANMPWPMYQYDLKNSGTLPLPPMCGMVVAPGPVEPWDPTPPPPPPPPPAPWPSPWLPSF